MKEPDPVSDPPGPDEPVLSTVTAGGWMLRVTATIPWADRHTETIQTFAYAWTSTRVWVGVPSEPDLGSGLGDRYHMIWIPISAVKQAPPPTIGDYVPARAGTTQTTTITPTHCTNGHLLAGKCKVSPHNCSHRRRSRCGGGWTSRSCNHCGDVVSGPPPHDTPTGRTDQRRLDGTYPTR